MNLSKPLSLLLTEWLAWLRNLPLADVAQKAQEEAQASPLFILGHRHLYTGAVLFLVAVLYLVYSSLSDIEQVHYTSCEQAKKDYFFQKNGLIWLNERSCEGISGLRNNDNMDICVLLKNVDKLDERAPFFYKFHWHHEKRDEYELPDMGDFEDCNWSREEIDQTWPLFRKPVEESFLKKTEWIAYNNQAKTLYYWRHR